MKTIRTAICVTIAFLHASWAENVWTWQAVEHEDATSAHYYFFESNGERIQRVWWVWNGGAQNQPTVTEYVLGPGRITIRRLLGKREDLVDLTHGRKVKLELQSEHALPTTPATAMLVPDSSGKQLIETQRVDLKNLLDLLAKERKPYQKPSK